MRLCLVYARMLHVWDLICSIVVAITITATAAIGNKQLSSDFCTRQKKKRERKCSSVCEDVCAVSRNIITYNNRFGHPTRAAHTLANPAICTDTHTHMNLVLHTQVIIAAVCYFVCVHISFFLCFVTRFALDSS